MLLPRCCNLVSIHEVFLTLLCHESSSLAHARAEEQVYRHEVAMEQRGEIAGSGV